MTSEHSTIEAEDFALEVTSLIAGNILDEWIWQAFGYKRRPRRGRFFDRFISPETLAEERFLKRELLLVSLVRSSQALVSLLAPPAQCISVFARILEHWVDGDRAGEEVWRSFGYPSRAAALQAIVEGFTSYRMAGPGKHAQVFANRMAFIVRPKTRATWIAGVAMLFASSESPITNIRWPLQEFLQTRSVIGKVALREHRYLQISQELLDVDAE